MPLRRVLLLPISNESTLWYVFVYFFNLPPRSRKYFLHDQGSSSICLHTCISPYIEKEKEKERKKERKRGMWSEYEKLKRRRRRRISPSSPLSLCDSAPLVDLHNCTRRGTTRNWNVAVAAGSSHSHLLRCLLPSATLPLSLTCTIYCTRRATAPWPSVAHCRSPIGHAEFLSLTIYL